MAYAPLFAAASRKYRPQRLRLLFVAEAPPQYESGRFFYFPNLTEGDTLFLEMMKVLYPLTIGFDAVPHPGTSAFVARRVRLEKDRLLRRFCLDGFYLIDAFDQPMPRNASGSAKRKLIEHNLPVLERTVCRLCHKNGVPIILIGSTTYVACADRFRQNGLNVLNTAFVDHPARGGQQRFRDKLIALIGECRIGTSDGREV